MGTWDTGSFDNDAALDFLGELETPAEIAAMIRDGGQSADADTAARVIAACDLVAALLGRPDPAMPEDILPRLGDAPHPEAALLAEARRAIAHLRARSELAELWADGDDAGWQAALDDLLARLDPDAPYEPKGTSAAPAGVILAHCFACEQGIPEDEAVTLEHVIDDGIIYATMALYAHRACVEDRFDPPHWNADGTPTESTLAQFARAIGVEDG
ncbi:DUF4259 domain-containing protein [Roseovarius faecimaris]|uniref:DUF4259 domain-containing protein n=1 Tax=Roseovarius faecimaris TaxID=2494550 RepID=A0A6I6IS54_9RHOB|nr:DUF4259 domain-containing protein [Roseovarius faecimaris]QGX99012.1 DUF4259 domain-containing protein [Roseovarius faecimaris]